MIRKHALRNLCATLTAELERVDRGSPVAALARTILDGDLPVSLEPKPRKIGGIPGRRPNAERAIRAADLCAEGMSTYQIASALGCSVGTVARDLKRQGVAPAGKHYTVPDSERIERLRAMRADGKTLEEMGEAEGITRERVRQICTKAGIETAAGTRPLNKIERRAVSEYVAGASLEQAAAIGGVNPATVRNWVIRAGEKVRPSPKTKKRHPRTVANAERAAQLYQRGLTGKEIALAVGLKKPEMIYRLLAIAGVRPSRHRKVDFESALSTGREL